MADDNVARARAWFEQIWNQRRIDQIEAFTSPNSVAHLETGDVDGIAAFRTLYQQFTSAFPDLKLQVEGTVAEGDNVVVRWTALGTHQGEGFGLKPTGCAIRLPGMTWVRFEHGLIVEGWDAWDHGGLLARLQQAAAEPKPAGR